ncbi:MAG: aminotransferase class III-fold pyridoxal phosphate-dependent enzyme [Candidatus Eisenbacteria bacterium]|nr:aminotransferase class III-fold pyridoxal phosphate-dependent enzyme [Candidatus Eisenbacteria bacterium]
MYTEQQTIIERLRGNAGPRFTQGLSDEVVLRFLESSPSLARAIALAGEAFDALDDEDRRLIELPEEELCEVLQEELLNFYPEGGISRYVPLGAAGPWIVTTHGAVLHDSGGYGMLGLGHAPQTLLDTMARPFPMANVMTPALAHRRFTHRLLSEIGHSRGSCPFTRFVCMNSGSEAVTVAARITDRHARLMTDPGGEKEGRKVRILSLEQGFHGRTYRPARMSESTRAVYARELASFRDADDVQFVPANDVDAIKAAFAAADRDGVFFEGVFIEPVMGEGDSGLALTREFYDAARALSREHGTMLVVDSIQAALRAHGCLSIIDYPGFSDCDPPDMETYSKALNAGQFPLSVLALNDRAAAAYGQGTYGNTMTTNPRALEVGCSVLDSLTDSLRENVRTRGRELLEGCRTLASEHSGAIREVRGTGLIVCIDLEPSLYQVEGRGGFEEYLRTNGIVMIHGGHNGLRFTPHLGITSEEIALILDKVAEGLSALRRDA